MDKLQAAITHINVSVKNPIDRATMISCIKGRGRATDWSYHVNTFFLETPIPLMHDIVLSGIFSFNAGILNTELTEADQNLQRNMFSICTKHLSVIM